MVIGLYIAWYTHLLFKNDFQSYDYDLKVYFLFTAFYSTHPNINVKVIKNLKLL